MHEQGGSGKPVCLLGLGRGAMLEVSAVVVLQFKIYVS